MGKSDLGMIFIGLAGLGLVYALFFKGSGNGGGSWLPPMGGYQPKHYYFVQAPTGPIPRPQAKTIAGRRTSKQYVDIINAAGKNTVTKAGTQKFASALKAGTMVTALSSAGSGSPMIYNAPEAASGQPLISTHQRVLVR